MDVVTKLWEIIETWPHEDRIDLTKAKKLKQELDAAIANGMSCLTASDEAIARLIPLMDEDLGCAMACILAGYFRKENYDGPTTERQEDPPLSDHAKGVLRRLLGGPVVINDINPGVMNRFRREDLVEIVRLPSPYKSHTDWVQITEAGKAAING